ncbi:hypothetical protein D3C79_537600 [compost metagenome]
MKAHQLIEWGEDVVLDVKHHIDSSKFQVGGDVEFDKNQNAIFITLDLVSSGLNPPYRMQRKIPAIYIEQGYVTKQETVYIFISQLNKVIEVYQ